MAPVSTSGRRRPAAAVPAGRARNGPDAAAPPRPETAQAVATTSRSRSVPCADGGSRSCEEPVCQRPSSAPARCLHAGPGPGYRVRARRRIAPREGRHCRREAFRPRSVGLWAVSALCLGCGSPAVDKQGARRQGEVVTLRLGAADPGSLRWRTSSTRSTGSRAAGSPSTWTSRRTSPRRPAGRPSWPGLRAGHVDLAFIPSRDWAATGDPGFAALQAPFLVLRPLATTSSPGATSPTTCSRAWRRTTTWWARARAGRAPAAADP